MYCENEKCRAENPTEAQFCRECGTPLNKKVFLSPIIFKRSFGKYNKSISKIVIVLLSVSILVCIIGAIKWESIEQQRSDARHAFEKRHPEKSWYESEEEWDSTLEAQYYDSQWHMYQFIVPFSGVMIGLFSIIGVIQSILYLFKWKRYELKLPFGEIKEDIMKYVFRMNKTEENIRMREIKGGELKLRSKIKDAKGLFYLTKNKENEAVLIGRKFKTQYLIRSMLNKDADFLEM